MVFFNPVDDYLATLNAKLSGVFQFLKGKYSNKTFKERENKLILSIYLNQLSSAYYEIANYTHAGLLNLEQYDHAFKRFNKEYRKRVVYPLIEQNTNRNISGGYIKTTDVTDLMDKVSPQYVQGKKVTLKANDFAVRLKSEQAFNALSLLNETTTQHLIDIVDKKGIIGDFFGLVINVSKEEDGLDKLANMFPDVNIEAIVGAVETVNEVAQVYAYYHGFINDIIGLGLSPVEQTATLNAVQNLSKITGTDFVANIDKYSSELIENIEQFINQSYKAKRSLALDKLAEKLGIVEKHNGLADCWLADVIIEKELKDVYDGLALQGPVHLLDIETTSFSDDTGALLNIGVSSYGSSSVVNGELKGSKIMYVQRHMSPEELDVYRPTESLLTKFGMDEDTFRLTYGAETFWIQLMILALH